MSTLLNDVPFCSAFATSVYVSRSINDGYVVHVYEHSFVCYPTICYQNPNPVPVAVALIRHVAFVAKFVTVHLKFQSSSVMS